MDLVTTSLAGLVAIGTVNVIDIFHPISDSRIKFGIAFVVAFIVLFIPVELGNQLLNQAKIALEVAVASSGTYKLFQVIGSKV
jgi:hypothetical protein